MLTFIGGVLIGMILGISLLVWWTIGGSQRVRTTLRVLVETLGECNHGAYFQVYGVLDVGGLTTKSYVSPEQLAEAIAIYGLTNDHRKSQKDESRKA